METNPDLERKFIDEDPECDVLRGRLNALKYASFYDGLLATKIMRKARKEVRKLQVRAN